MTAKELLVPRFEIVAEYPKCLFKKGDILLRVNRATSDIYHVDQNAPVGGIYLTEIEKYPHLFRRLNWWENRKKEDMPMKLICKAIPDDTEITEVTEWDMENFIGWINKKERTCASLLSFNPEYGYFPVD